MDLTSLGFRTDLALLQAAGSTVEDCGNHLVVRTPDNPTYRWGNFILINERVDISDAQPWLDRFAEVLPESEHLAFGRDGSRGTPGDLAAFRAAGLRVDASAVMTARRVTDPLQVNTQAVCRPLRSDDDWEQRVDLAVRVHGEDDVDAFRTFAVQKAASTREQVEQGRGVWLGAFLEGRLVSTLGIFETEPGVARYQSVETDPDHRRGGLAGTLVHQAARSAFDTMKAKTLVMVADPEYVAIRIYRALGFQQTETMLQTEWWPAEDD